MALGTIELAELTRRMRDMTVGLMEVQDLTQQLGEAMDRRDQVSVRMMLSMRELPVRQLQERDENLRDYVESLPEEQAIRAHELLDGTAVPETAGEAALCEGAAKARRQMEAVQAADRRLSLGFSGDRSFYKTFR